VQVKNYLGREDDDDNMTFAQFCAQIEEEEAEEETEEIIF
jgi:hypothetical protein